MVEVFKTNVQEPIQAEIIVNKLLPVLKRENPLAYSGTYTDKQTFDNLPKYRINFDLDDCDKILRVEGENISTEKVITLVENYGFHVEVLE